MGEQSVRAIMPKLRSGDFEVESALRWRACQALKEAGEEGGEGGAAADLQDAAARRVGFRGLAGIGAFLCDWVWGEGSTLSGAVRVASS